MPGFVVSSLLFKMIEDDQKIVHICKNSSDTYGLQVSEIMNILNEEDMRKLKVKIFGCRRYRKENGFTSLSCALSKEGLNRTFPGMDLTQAIHTCLGIWTYQEINESGIVAFELELFVLKTDKMITEFKNKNIQLKQWLDVKHVTPEEAFATLMTDYYNPESETNDLIKLALFSLYDYLEPQIKEHLNDPNKKIVQLMAEVISDH